MGGEEGPRAQGGDGGRVETSFAGSVTAKRGGEEIAYPFLLPFLKWFLLLKGACVIKQFLLARERSPLRNLSTPVHQSPHYRQNGP